MEELTRRLIHALVGVSAEIVALSLKQIRWQLLAAVTVEITERSGERWDRNARERRFRDDRAPVLLSTLRESSLK